MFIVYVKHLVLVYSNINIVASQIPSFITGVSSAFIFLA